MKPALVVMAAGMGSRYGGLKQVDGLGPSGETIIDYSVYDALKAGFGRIIFVIRKSIEADFREVFDRKYHGTVPYELVFQELAMLPDGFSVPEGRVKPWGTAHALWVARHVVDVPFAAINADDFYGFDSFRVMAEALSDSSLSSGKYFMIGYELGNTLSEEGGVSRGVCSTDSAGNLVTVVERTHIERKDGIISSHEPDGSTFTLDTHVPVSMNFWGFTSDFFSRTEELMVEFFSGAMTNAKAEFYIPTVVNRLITDGKASCQVLPTSASWFGVTYPGDRPHVVEKLQKLNAEGLYPSPLF